jgi:hypothetical protein
MTVGNDSQNILDNQWHYEGLGFVICQATYTWMVRLMLGALHPLSLTPAYGCIFLQTALTKVIHS